MSEVERLAYNLAARDSSWPRMPMILVKTKSGMIVDVTSYAAAIFGYDVEELVGQTVEVLLPLRFRAAHALWRQDVAVPLLRLMGNGRHVFGLKKDGTEFPVQVLLTETEALGERIGVAFITDMSQLPGEAS